MSVHMSVYIHNVYIWVSNHAVRECSLVGLIVLCYTLLNQEIIVFQNFCSIVLLFHCMWQDLLYKNITVITKWFIQKVLELKVKLLFLHFHLVFIKWIMTQCNLCCFCVLSGKIKILKRACLLFSVDFVYISTASNLFLFLFSHCTKNNARILKISAFWNYTRLQWSKFFTALALSNTFLFVIRIPLLFLLLQQNY